MDLREYDYITERSDTLPRNTLETTRKVLASIPSQNAQLIDKVLEEGYIEPPVGWRGGSCYQISLSKDEIKAVFDDLIRAESLLDTEEPDADKTKKKLARLISCWSHPLHETPETYEQYKSKQAYFDLRGMSFDAFLDLIFEHPVADKNKKSDEWYWKIGIDRWIDIDRPHVVDLYGQLFCRSDELLTRYSKEKLEQGFWFIMGASSLDFTAGELLRDAELAVELKERLIESMYSLYEKLFYNETLDGTSHYMWWDSFCYSYCVPGQRDPINNESDRRLQNAMFRTLVRILALDSDLCQGAALHGLAHLRHPDTERTIQDFIRRNRQLTKEQVDYAKKCITGDVL